MRTKLIQALRAAADEVEMYPLRYDWQSMKRCNCGLVALQLLGGDQDALSEAVRAYDHIWGEMGAEAARCQATGIPIPEVFLRLNGEAGLKFTEFESLENLSNPEVLSALNVPICEIDKTGAWDSYDKPEAFVAYARKWAYLLEKE